MRVGFVTYGTPWSTKELFVLREIVEISKCFKNIVIFPIIPTTDNVFHEIGHQVTKYAVHEHPLNIWVLLNTIHTMIKEAKHVPKLLVDVVRFSKNIGIILRNMIIIPVGIRLLEAIRRENVSHVHACWGTIPATVAWAISKITGIPWSFELQRWDIYRNNMLREKVRSAKFVRCISERGKQDLLEIIGNEFSNKVFVVRGGVAPQRKDFVNEKIKYILNNYHKPLTIFTPANLEEVKGHKYLIDAIRILVKQGFKDISCRFYGDGPLRNELKNYSRDRGVAEYISFCGMITNGKLLNMYKNNEADIVIVPSINTSQGEHEGIPVALLEGMSFAIPVVSTKTGSIPELLSNNAGLIIPEKSPQSLASAIKSLIEDKKLAASLAFNGWEKISKEYHIKKNTETLIKLIKNEIFLEETNIHQQFNL